MLFSCKLVLRYEQLLQACCLAVSGPRWQLISAQMSCCMASLLICNHMLGVWPDLMRVSVQELTLNNPNIVNAKKNTELTYGKGTFLSNHQ